MSEMIERVAMALAADIEDGFPRFTKQRWNELTELARATMRQRARVAIEAMREPTQDMEGAAIKFVRPYHDISDLDWIRWVPRDFFKLAWRGMIDAALK